MMPTKTRTRTGLRDPFIAQLSDDELVEEARRIGNDNGAYEELYRRHENAARNVARHIMRSRQDADDVVNESFAGVIAAIGNGAGPRTNFRQYLMACVRNSCKSRRWSGDTISTDPSIMEQNGVCFEDPDRLSEQGLVASAFSSLSADWQLTLWLTAVEERPTSEVAEQLGRRPGAVAALAHRAREAFAEAYLAQHQVRNTSPACAKISPKLAHYVRGNSGDIDAEIVERHLVNCVPCSCAVDELRDLNSSLRTLTGPAPLLGAGLGAAGAGAALIGAAAPVAAGGWSFGALSGATLAKVAVLGAILVPAGAIVSTDSAPTTLSRSAVITVPDAVRSTQASGGTTKSSGAAVATADDAVSGSPSASAGADALASGDAVGGASGAASAGQAGAATDTLVAAAAGAIPPPVDDATSVVALPGASGVTLPTTPSAPPVSITIPVPGDTRTSVAVAAGASGGTVAASVTLPVVGGGAVIGVQAGSGGASVGVAVTVPVVTVPLSASISVPAGGTPAITTPVVSLPLVGVTVLPSVSVPSVPLVPAATLPSNSVVPTTVPSMPVVTILHGILGG
ncbi:MAG: polymerase, sigma-24 subunit, subfamily [Acidimicrobiales bacterium]|nr:polymerase, sigma-24 subunit, subfamily [Acidimicrobiales bacterium]